MYLFDNNGIVSIVDALNSAYDIEEGRPWWKVRLTAIGLTLGLALFILVSMTLVVAGPALAEKVAEFAVVVYLHISFFIFCYKLNNIILFAVFVCPACH